MWVRIKCFNLVETVCKTENAISSGYVAYIAAPISMQKRWKRQTNGHISTVSFGFRRDKAGRTKKICVPILTTNSMDISRGDSCGFRKTFPIAQCTSACVHRPWFLDDNIVCHPSSFCKKKRQAEKVEPVTSGDAALEVFKTCQTRPLNHTWKVMSHELGVDRTMRC